MRIVIIVLDIIKEWEKDLINITFIINIIIIIIINFCKW